MTLFCVALYRLIVDLFTCLSDAHLSGIQHHVGGQCVLQIIWMSCATNVIVAGLSSRQLRELMPGYFEVAACSTSINADDSSASGLATTWSVTLMVVSTSLPMPSEQHAQSDKFILTCRDLDRSRYLSTCSCYLESCR